MAFYETYNIPAALEDILAAFENVDRLAVWWGPDGFSNTFEVFELETGGKWIFTMHGPDGTNYPNEMIVKEFDRAAGRLVLEHTGAPHFVLTITLKGEEDGTTQVGWHQDFANPEFEAQMNDFLTTANQQVVNKLKTEVLRAQT